MKQLGNLAIVAARKKDCSLQIFDEEVSVYTGVGPERKGYSCNVWDDDSINKLIAFLNFQTEVVLDEKIRCI